MDRTQQINEDFQSFALDQNLRGREVQNSAAIICINCEEEIPEDRRKAVPGCLRCVTCQEEYELLEHWRH
nr:TraR/DksA C4-type zinc finger protein [Geomonas sp. Red32]